MFLIVIVMLAVANCGAAENDTNSEFTDTVVENVNYLFFRNFNASCVSQGCPALRNSQLCPSNNSTEVDQQVLTSLANCFTREMCGVVMDPRHLLPTTFNTDQAFPGLANIIKGECTILSNVSQMVNFSKPIIQVTASPSSNTYPLTINTTMNITIVGTIDCSFDLFLDPENSSASTSIKLPTVDAVFRYTFISQILASAVDFAKAFQVFYSNIDIEQLTFYMPDFFPNIDFGQILTANFLSYVQQGGIGQSMANTLANAYQAAFQATSSNCH